MPEKFVRDLMRVGLPTCRVNDSLAKAAQPMVERGTDAVIVLDEDGEWCGLITEDELAKAYAYHWEDMAAEDVMRPASEVRTVPPDIPAAAAAQLMSDWRVSHVFIMHSSSVTGMTPSAILSFRDIVKDMGRKPG